MTYDVVIIGAGAAGLAAARELSASGQRVCVLEARDRVGGRIHTLHQADLALPIELGAEFVHGQSPTTLAVVEAAALAMCELPDDHSWSRGGKWERVHDFWGQLAKLRAKIDRDVSFAAFLRSRRSLPPRLRELACNFVEGYHAAHADRISALALQSADEEQEGDTAQFRIVNGQDALIAWLRAGLDPTRTELRLSTAVTSVEWSKGHVVCRAGEVAIRARSAILTLPIGVWKAGTIRFDPPLRDKEKAIAKLEAGHVVKIAFRFRERFWKPFNFVHSSNRFMPTWWTTAPVVTPILTGWAGGHAADALLAEGSDAMIDRALDAMAETFAVPRRELARQLIATYSHDWQADPFSRGAYSYAAVGGRGAHDALRKPLQDTLFFAGEATSSDETGTVSGAIESGKRAARALLKSSS